MLIYNIFIHLCDKLVRFWRGLLLGKCDKLVGCWLSFTNSASSIFRDISTRWPCAGFFSILTAVFLLSFPLFTGVDAKKNVFCLHCVLEVEMGFLAAFPALSKDKAEWLRVGGDYKGEWFGLLVWGFILWSGRSWCLRRHISDVCLFSVWKCQSDNGSIKIYISSHYDSTENIQCAFFISFSGLGRGWTPPLHCHPWHWIAGNCLRP